MRLREIIRIKKTVVDWGEWSDAKMPASAFSMSKRKGGGYRLGAKYRWRVIKFQAAGHNFRILVAFHQEIPNFQALLGMEVGNDMRLIADTSYHGTHPGWHVHATCDDFKSVPTGVYQGPWIRRFPNAKNFHRLTDYTFDQSDMSDDLALEIVKQRYNIPDEEGQDSMFTSLYGRLK